MSLPQVSRTWILQHKPHGKVVLEGSSPTFKLVQTELPILDPGQVLVQTLYISNEPAQRGWIDAEATADRLYVRPIQLGEAIRAYVLSKVFASRSDSLRVGDRIVAWSTWSEFSVLDAAACTLVTELPRRLSMTHYLGALAGTGLTAWYGLQEVVAAEPKDCIVVSGASGSTGSMVVQIAKKLIGCRRVVGMASTDRKCRWVESIGADICLNYTSETFEDDLTRATDSRCDVYWDNVGGRILDLMLARMARHGRVAACGAISSYNGEPVQLQHYMNIVAMRLQIKGFIVIDFVEKGDVSLALETIKQAIADGKILLDEESEDVVEASFEDVPKTWTRLFDGKSSGKLITNLTST